jgi:hypothetical protein
LANRSHSASDALRSVDGDAQSFDDCGNLLSDDRESALVRLSRLRGRPVLACGIGADFLVDHPKLATILFLKPPVAELFKIPMATASPAPTSAKRFV